ncbi:hypothetical protein CATMIT_01697, partial [Catenibacterium mitsuokai DSM 15897]
EADQVGQRVVLHAELALGVGQPGDPAVDAVEDGGDEDRHAGLVEAALGGGDDRVETGEHAAGGEQIGQQVNAASARAGRGLGFHNWEV